MTDMTDDEINSVLNNPLNKPEIRRKLDRLVSELMDADPLEVRTAIENILPEATEEELAAVEIDFRIEALRRMVQSTGIPPDADDKTRRLLRYFLPN